MSSGFDRRGQVILGFGARRRHRCWTVPAIGAACGVAIAGCGSSSAPTPPTPAVSRTTVSHQPASRATHQRAPTSATSTVAISRVSWRLPAPLSREVVFAVGGDIELAGGLIPSGATTSAVVLVNLRTGAARGAGRLAIAVHDAAGASIGGSQFVFGGGDTSSDAFVQQLVRDSAAATVGRLPAARSDLVAVTVGASAYLIGGYDGISWASAVLSTTDGKTFTTLATLPVPVRYPAIAVQGNVIWIFGGQAAGGPADTIQRVNVVTGQSQVVGRMSSPLTDASALALGGKFYLCGGLVANTATDAVRSFDPVTRRLVLVGHLPTALHDAGSVVIGGVGYLLGGEDPSPTSEVVALQPAPATPPTAGSR
jgi:hypothetical protein